MSLVHQAEFDRGEEMWETEIKRGKPIKEKTVMTEKRYPVHLSAEQQQELHQLIRTGKATAHQQMAARVLLKADESHEQHCSSSQIAEALEISPRTVIPIKQRFLQHALPPPLRSNHT